MEPLYVCLKQINSPLYDRRLMLLILKKYGHGRRAFTESSRFPKIAEERRLRQYEPIFTTIAAPSPVPD